MISLALGVLAVSLLGSLHCAGMCGGLVAVYAGGPSGRSRLPWMGHVAYNGGRLVAYAALGALAGLAGSLVDLAGALVGAQRIAAALAGGLIAVWGLAAVLQGCGVRLPRLSAPRLVRGLAGRGLATIAAMSDPARGLCLGLVTGLLPCGWLWAFVATAAGSGHALSGVAIMGLFWLGTLPVMATLGIGVRALAGPLRRHLPIVCGIAMLALGGLALFGRLAGPGLPSPTPLASDAHGHH